MISSIDSTGFMSGFCGSKDHLQNSEKRRFACTVEEVSTNFLLCGRQVHAGQKTEVACLNKMWPMGGVLQFCVKHAHLEAKAFGCCHCQITELFLLLMG